MMWRLAAVVLMAAVPVTLAATNKPALLASPGAPIAATADSLEYAQDGAILKAIGNVIITNGANRLTADRVTVKLDSKETWATGHVVLTQGSNVWTGERLYCNLATDTVSGKGPSDVTALPFHGFVSGEFRKVGNSLTGDDATITTCNLPYPNWHYHLRAAHATLVQNSSVSVSHVFFYLAGVPMLYFPYWTRSVDGNGIKVVPGYSSSMGAYLLSSYSYSLADTLRGTTHLDYRTRRGPALGQDFDWAATNKAWSGGLELYGTSDQDPLVDRDPTADIDQTRYRMLLFHDHALGNRTRLLTRMQYLSDAYVMDDFFRSEYRVEPQPDNFVSLTHRGDNFTAGLLCRPRLNDFYDAVARLPEAQLEFPMQQVGDSMFYYESRSEADYLEKLWQAGNTNTSYSTLRVDTRHSVSTPLKIGVLNFIPRVAARGTYYSSTLPDEIEADSGGSALRAMYEAGAQLSFKMFKVYREADKNDGGLRHVAEPYANYTYIPSPNIEPQDLYSFDEVDALGGQNSVILGVRNKLQTKMNGQPFDLVDLNTWVNGNFNATTNESTFDSLYVDARVRPWQDVALDCDGRFSLSGGTPEEVNTHLIFGSPVSTVAADIEYRYLRSQSSLLSGKVTYRPNERWSYTYAARYEIETSRLEEHSLWAQKNYDCMSVAVGLNEIPSYTLTDGSVRSDEFQVMFRIWLKAFPKFGVAVD